MPVITLNCMSGARRVRRNAIINVENSVVTVSLQTPDGNTMYPSATVRLDHFQARLANLDQQQVRIPQAEGENDLMMASSDGDVWLWVRTTDRDDGGADVVIDRQTLHNAVIGRNMDL